MSLPADSRKGLSPLLTVGVINTSGSGRHGWEGVRVHIGPHWTERVGRTTPGGVWVGVWFSSHLYYPFGKGPGQHIIRCLKNKKCENENEWLECLKQGTGTLGEGTGTWTDNLVNRVGQKDWGAIRGKNLHGNRDIVVVWTVGVWEDTNSWLKAQISAIPEPNTKAQRMSFLSHLLRSG